MIEIVILRVLLHYPFWIQLLWALLGRRFQFLSYFYISTTGRMSLLVDTRAVQSVTKYANVSCVCSKNLNVHSAVGKLINIYVKYIPREDTGGLSREYVIRLPSVSYKATKGVPLYSHSR